MGNHNATANSNWKVMWGALKVWPAHDFYLIYWSNLRLYNLNLYSNQQHTVTGNTPILLQKVNR